MASDGTMKVIGALDSESTYMINLIWFRRTKMIQIFRKDGKPFLIDESKEGYDKDLYTDIMPPSNLYLPVKFDGGEWVGTPYEEWKNNKLKMMSNLKRRTRQQ